MTVPGAHVCAVMLLEAALVTYNDRTDPVPLYCRTTNSLYPARSKQGHDVLWPQEKSGPGSVAWSLLESGLTALYRFPRLGDSSSPYG